MPQIIHHDTPQPRIATAVAPLIERLAAIAPGRHHVLSGYIRLGPGDRARTKYLTEFKSRVKALEGDPTLAALQREERLAVERDRSRILGYLEHSRGLPHARGLAIFACEELDLFEVAPLPRVHRERLILDDTPWIAELVAAEEEFEPILVALIDRAHGRFFEVSVMGALELPGLVVASKRGGRFHSDRGDAPGWGERDYHGRLKEERHRHYAAAVGRLDELLRGRAVRGIVLAGPTDYATGLAHFLPDQLRNRLLGTIKLNPTAASTAEVQTAAFTAAEQHERQALTAERLALDDAFGSGWAVNGAREALRALHRGQSRTLYICEGLEGRGFRCTTTGRLVLAKGECRGEGEPLPVRDLVDEAIEEALRQRVRVVIVPERGDDAVDGLAATLRFR